MYQKHKNIAYTKHQTTQTKRNLFIQIRFSDFYDTIRTTSLDFFWIGTPFVPITEYILLSQSGDTLLQPLFPYKKDL